MIKFLKKLTRYKGFLGEEFSESDEDVKNPCRGWFDLHNYSIEEEPDFIAEKKRPDDDISVVLVLIDIGALREVQLAEEHFDRIDRIIGHFYDEGKDIILRVAYDHEGKGMEREPSFFKNVREHAEQVSGLLKKYYKEIFLYQGLLIGQWGEMHTSRYANDERLSELYEIFDAAKPDGLFLAVRRPVQWRMLNHRVHREDRITPCGLGIFNDGMFGSGSDLGTYDSSNKSTEKWNSAWNRKNELEFGGNVSDIAPYGGEALFGEGFFAQNKADTYLEELKQLKVTYLNRNHDAKLIEEWKKLKIQNRGIWNGKSYYDYIGAHLGYRFVVRKAEAFKADEGCRLEITLANTGFAPIYRETELYLLVKDHSGGEKSIDLEEGLLNRIVPDSEIMTEIVLSGLKGKVYLLARDKTSGREINFANSIARPDGLMIGELV